MRKAARIYRYLPLTIVVVILGYFMYGCYAPFWQFDHLEQNASKVITASQLQAWATNVLAQYPTGTNLSQAESRAIVPPPLRDIAPRMFGPSVVIIQTGDTNNPPWVMVSWGSGVLGAEGFEVGPPEFTGRKNGEKAWQPGVYFFQKTK